jgi:ABC-2 type transport system ATP-binding protein
LPPSARRCSRGDGAEGWHFGELSGGQRQRLYFALAICGDPDLLVLDEPTVGMDVEARRAFVTSIQTLAAAGKTIVFTTHYLREELPGASSSTTARSSRTRARRS